MEDEDEEEDEEEDEDPRLEMTLSCSPDSSSGSWPEVRSRPGGSLRDERRRLQGHSPRPRDDCAPARKDEDDRQDVRHPFLRLLPLLDPMPILVLTELLVTIPTSALAA